MLFSLYYRLNVAKEAIFIDVFTLYIFSGLNMEELSLFVFFSEAWTRSYWRRRNGQPGKWLLHTGSWDESPRLVFRLDMDGPPAPVPPSIVGK